ncbi:MAG TPA: hypothetical protein DHV96_06840 [Lachnospiraceae bacterium]|nr:hypothetical protein [Lachnospiraceae bacterium]
MNNSYNAGMAIDIKSIQIYLLFFLISFLFCYLSERMFSKKKKRLGFFLAVVSIFVLCLLAALRSTKVGVDISVYLLPNFNRATSYSDFLSFYSVASSQMELMFSLLVYEFAQLGNLSALFFTIQLLILLPIYIVLYRNCNNCSMTTAFIIYVFLFYNFSLSGMRQSIAMSLVFLAIDYLMKSNYKKFVFWGCVAVLFHKGALISLIVIALIIIFENKKSYKRLLWCLAFILLAFFAFYNQFANLLAKLFWIINPRYSYYIVTYMSDGIQWGNIPTTEIVLKFGIVLVSILFGHYRKKQNTRNISILAISLLGRYFVLLNARMYEALRIAYYFDIFCITLAGKTVYQQKHQANRRIISIFLILLAFLYWIYFIMYVGGYQTNVFTFV